mmetsp:Transcript_8118/g.9669  ORF Transcript_8118/g.9669 Transcript_8118/m.9669 type:complete len:110 (+) Transcript_8118:115-444(+)
MTSFILSALLLLSPAIAQPDWCRWVPLASKQYVPACSSYIYPGPYAYAPLHSPTYWRELNGTHRHQSGCAGNAFTLRPVFAALLPESKTIGSSHFSQSDAFAHDGRETH